MQSVSSRNLSGDMGPSHPGVGPKKLLDTLRFFESKKGSFGASAENWLSDLEMEFGLKYVRSPNHSPERPKLHSELYSVASSRSVRTDTENEPLCPQTWSEDSEENLHLAKDDDTLRTLESRTP